MTGQNITPIMFIMSALNWQTICKLYTLEQIQERVTLYQDQLDRAMVKLYDKDTTQGRQKVESAELDKIESVLAVWMKALECKSGNGGGARVVSVNFRGNERGGF